MFLYGQLQKKTNFLTSEFLHALVCFYPTFLKGYILITFHNFQ